jgi:hypothetical protein
MNPIVMSLSSGLKKVVVWQVAPFDDFRFDARRRRKEPTLALIRMTSPAAIFAVLRVARNIDD